MRKKSVLHIFLTTAAMFLFNLTIKAEALTDLTAGMKYFLYGVIVFVVLAFSLTIYFLALKNKYHCQSKVIGSKEDKEGLGGVTLRH